MRWFKFLIIVVFLALFSCTPQRYTVVTDSEQYGIIHDKVYDIPISYKTKYVDLKGIEGQICELERQNLDNLYYQRDTNVFRCSSTFKGYEPLFFQIKEK